MRILEGDSVSRSILPPSDAYRAIPEDLAALYTNEIMRSVGADQGADVASGLVAITLIIQRQRKNNDSMSPSNLRGTTRPSRDT